VVRVLRSDRGHVVQGTVLKSADAFYSAVICNQKKCMIFKLWSDVDTFYLCFYSYSDHPEDGHMTGRNMSANLYAIILDP